MQITLEDRTPARIGSDPGRIATEPRGNARLRKVVFGAALAIAPATLGSAIGLILRSRRAGVIAGGVTAAALGLGRWQLERSFNDEPDYEVEERIGRLEIRRYDARVEAETVIEEADFKTALERGFERLAGYIFGANEHHEKLGMTTPVTTKWLEGDIRVAFMMPVCRTASSLPQPADDRVEIVEVAPRRIAVIKFRGARRERLVARKQAELLELVDKAGYLPRSTPCYAGFDPPWTLPVLRRNEVWVEIL